MVGKAVRSKRNNFPKSVVSKTGVTISECYCRMCIKMLPVSKFYQTTDIFLDKSGFQSICKDHISQIYTDFYQSEKNMEKVLLRMCRILNVKYSDEAISATRLHLQTIGKSESDENVFGFYKSKVVSTSKENVNATSAGLDLTFREPIIFTPKSDSLENLQDNTDLKENEIKRLRQFWGNKFEIEDYEWLEFELSKWKAAKKLERNEESLLQLIVLKIFDIRKARDEGKDTTSLEASYQKLLDTSGLRPKDMASLSATNKQNDCWGTITEMIETTTPAEYYKDKKLFANFDGLLYFKNFIIRCIKNFITFSKEFNLSDEISNQDDINFDEIEKDSSSSEILEELGG